MDDDMTLERALSIIETSEDDHEEEALVISAWQYLYESDEYLNLPQHFTYKIEALLDLGVIN